MITLKDAITGSVAKFDHAIAGVLYYTLFVEDDQYQLVIDMNDKDDVGTTSFEAEYKGITLMRYIRKGMADETFVKIN
jgi:hypothetical protein